MTPQGMAADSALADIVRNMVTGETEREIVVRQGGLHAVGLAAGIFQKQGIPSA